MLFRILILFFPLFLFYTIVYAQEKYDTIPSYQPELVTYSGADTSTELSIYREDFGFLDTIRKIGITWYENKLCIAYLIDNTYEGYLCHLIGIYGFPYGYRNLLEHTTEVNTKTYFQKLGKKELLVIILNISIETTDSTQYLHSKELQIWDLKNKTCLLNLTVDADQSIYPPMCTDCFLETYHYTVPYSFKRNQLIIGETISNGSYKDGYNPIAGTFKWSQNCFVRVH